MTLCEDWVDLFPNQIPKRKYFLRLRMGEEHGLVIHLFSSDYEVQLDFDLVEGLNVLDEGVQLNSYPNYVDGDSFLQHRSKQYPSTIYMVNNGAYAHTIKQLMGDLLFSAYNLRQYNIITENYVIMVIAHAEPKIHVKSIDE